MTVKSDKENMDTVVAMIMKRKEAFQSVLPDQMKHILSADRLIKIIQSALSRNPGLLKCTPQSLVKCMMQAAELGLELNGITGEAYAVPFWNGKIKAKEATFIIGYKGFIQNAYRGGGIKKLDARVILDGDVYDVEFGLEERLYHKPMIDTRSRMNGGGELPAKRPLIATYAIAIVSEEKKFELMTYEDVERIRLRSKGKNKSNDDEYERQTPWDTDYEEMAKKTVIRRLAKTLPLSPALKKAIEYDTAQEIGDSRPILDTDFLLDGLEEAAATVSNGPKAEQMAERIKNALPANHREEQPRTQERPQEQREERETEHVPDNRSLDQEIAMEQAAAERAQEQPAQQPAPRQRRNWGG